MKNPHCAPSIMGHRQTSPETPCAEFESMFSLSHATSCVPASFAILNIASLFNEWTMLRRPFVAGWFGPATEQPLMRVQQERVLAATSVASIPARGSSQLTVSAFIAATAASNIAGGGCTALGGSVRLVGDGYAVTGSRVDEESNDSHDTARETIRGDAIFGSIDSPCVCLQAVMLESAVPDCAKAIGLCVAMVPPKPVTGEAMCKSVFVLSSGADGIGSKERIRTGSVARRRGGAAACASFLNKFDAEGVNVKDREEPMFIAAAWAFTAGTWATFGTVACKSGAAGLKVDAVVFEGTKG